MVSSAPAPLTNLPVSYAESVKKAHSPRSNAVRNSLGDFPTVSGASGISSSSSPPSNATSQLPKLLSSIEAIGGSQAGASDFPELPTETSSQNIVEDHNGLTNYVHLNANTVPKAAPVVNVWTERLKEQMALAHLHVHQPHRQPRAIVTSSVGTPSVPHRLRPTGMGTSPVPSTSTSRSSPSQTMSLNGDDNDHDPFIVRMPSHLSRHSSSKSIRLVNDTDNWQDVAKPPSIDLGGNDGGEKPRSSESHAGAYSSSNSADLSRKNSIDSTRHQSDSVQMFRLNSRSVFEGNSTGSHSAPYSRVESRAGSSASSPRLQVRGRRLPDDELTVVYDLRHEAPKAPYNPPRMNSRVPERTTYHHHTFSHPPDFASHYFRSPPIPPTIDAPLHSARLSPLLSAIRHPYYASSVSGHTSPTYAGSRPPSGAGTPPYPVYPPYTTTCGYCHSRIPWDGFVSPIHPRPVPGFSTPLLQDEYIVPPPMHLSFFNPPFPDTTEPLPKPRLTQSERSYESSQDSHLPPAIISRNMVFGSIDLTHDRIHQTPNAKEATMKEGKKSKKSIERMAEQFSGFYIGFPPGEPVPPRQGHKKHSTKSLSRPSASPVADATDNAKAVDGAPEEGCKVVDEQPNTTVGEDVSAPGKKWVFGTTVKFDRPNEASPLEDSRSTSSEHSPPPVEPAQPVADQHPPAATSVVQPSSSEKPVTSPISETQNGPSTMKSEDGSTTSDVWEVKDYGYGFGDVSGTDNATDVIRRAKEVRERQRQVEWQKEQAQIQLQKEQEVQLGVQDIHTQHTWQEAHEERELWDQVKESGRGRPRRGSWAGSYGPHERGAYGGRRARGFGGRYQGRHPGRGGYHHQQRSSISSLTPPPQFNPLPLPGAGYMNGYVQIPSYTPPDYELYHPVPVTIPVNGAPPIPLPQLALPLPLDTTRSCLLSQLEYYLSSQNMAQDFFLRQRMDDQGWIPISLIASFNRVKKLTTDVNLVRDVLDLSSLIEVKGEYVRMAREQWKQFILPNAPRSIVCHPIESEAIEPQDDQVAYAQVQDGEIEEEGDTYGEDDDDEDIVFVIGEEAEGSWAPERRPVASEST